MDVAEAWIKSAEITKTARLKSAVANGVDVLAGWSAPVTERWDAEVSRRDELRTPEHLKGLMKAQREYSSARAVQRMASAQRRVAKAAHKGNPLAGPRRAARTADKAAKQSRRQAEAELMAARALYPKRLVRRAVELHAAHVTPTVGSSVALSMWESLTLWPVSMSAAAIAANITIVKLGRRAARPAEVEGDMSAEERRLAERLDPSYWAQHADDRGLSGTVPTPAEITQAGLVSHVRLDAKWTPKAFAAKGDEIRALIGARTDLRMEIKAGSHGDRATITLRTRSASDGLDLMGWKPGDAWAVDTVTGEAVPVPLGKRILIAGTSGSGKSTSARPLLAEASDRADHRLVIFDRKYVEGRTWEHRARIACELDDMRAVIQELIAEGEERLKSLPRGEDTVQISAVRPRITLFVDEMGELLSDCAAKYKDEDGKSADYLDVIAGLRTVARKYRAAEIILVPATQKPTLSGDGHGLDSQISGQLTVRLALAVATATETQSVFGSDAIEKGWRAHELPMPWVALMRDQDKGPKQRMNPIRMRWMTAQQVIDLPDRPIWGRGAVSAVTPPPVEQEVEQEVERPALRLVKGEVPPPRPESPSASPATNRDRVLEAIQAGARTGREVTDQTGLNKGTVSREVGRLVESGAVRRAEGGALVAGEVSA